MAVSAAPAGSLEAWGHPYTDMGRQGVAVQGLGGGWTVPAEGNSAKSQGCEHETLHLHSPQQEGWHGEWRPAGVWGQERHTWEVG